MEDYENARRYLATYLVEKDSSAVAHKLNGQIFEKLKQPEKALGCYKRSYEIEPSNDLVLKICGIMTDLPIEPGRAKYWVEVREKVSLVCLTSIMSRLAKGQSHTVMLCISSERQCLLLVKGKTVLL